MLLEATLTVVVISVSLVFLTRSFSASLRALGQARRYETALRIADNKLRELEAEYELPEPPTLPQDGTESTRDGVFRWTAQGEPFRAAPPGHAILNESAALDSLRVTVEETERSTPVRVILSTLVLNRH